MKAKLCAVIIASALASAVALAEPLDVKTGLWETTTTTETSGRPPVDTSKMTAEQKARFEAAMKAREAKGPRTRVHQGCLTKEKLAERPFDDPEEKDMKCTHTLQSSSRTHWKGTRECHGETNNVAQFDFEALSRERVKGVANVTVSDPGHAMKIRMTYSSRWLKSDCGNIK